MRTRIFTAIAVILCLAAGMPAQGADWRPSGQVKILVPFAPGGATDVLARIIALRLKDSMGHPVIVENKPGAGGQISIDALLQSAPDGRTLLLGTSAMTVNPATQKVRYDMLKDFAPVSLLASIVHVLAVRKDLPVSNVKELVNYARSKPGGLSYSSIGIGTSTHLEVELLNSIAGLSMVHVPYNGTPAQLNDLVSGRIDLMFNALGTLRPQIDGGGIKALAVTSSQRSALAPELPTMAEAGVPGYDATLWLGLLAPAATNIEIGESINNIVAASLKDADVAKNLRLQGMEGLAWGPKRFGEFIKTDLDRWAQVAKAANIKIE